MALPAASAAETSSRWCGTLTVTATTSMSDRVTSRSWSENTAPTPNASPAARSEEHTSELQSQFHLVCRLLLEKKNTQTSRAYKKRRRNVRSTSYYHSQMN